MAGLWAELLLRPGGGGCPWARRGGRASGSTAGQMPCLQRARARTTGHRPRSAPCHRQVGVIGKSRSHSVGFKGKERRTRIARRKKSNTKISAEANWAREWEEQGEREA